MSEWRLGKAVSGREADIARAQALAGLFAAELVGRGIDYINDWNLGSRLYDLFHPDELSRSEFDRAKDWVWPRDPILLDLDGNGLETVGLASNVYFDHDGDGVLTKTGWAGKNDALLVWDRNANGSIDTGAELMTDFGGLYLSERYRNLIAEWNRKLHVFEAFNGQYFFNLPQDKSQTDGANDALWEVAA